MADKADIGLIGLAVMGQNLILNMSDHGFTVAVYNRTTEKVTRFINGEAQGRDILGTYSLAGLCAALKRPRKVMLMVQAGRAVDVVIEQLLPHLEPGDIIIDGGTPTMRTPTVGQRNWRRRIPVRRSRHLLRGGRRAPGALNHARWLNRGMAASQAHIPGDCSEGGGRHALL